MAEVTMPDGSIVSFPDTMSDADMASAIKGQPAQMGGLWRAPAMLGSALAKGAMQGAGAIGDLQGAVQGLVDPFADRAAQAMGFKPPQAANAYGVSVPLGSPDVTDAGSGPIPTRSVLGSQNAVGLGQQAGVVDRSDLQPQGTGERLMTAGAEGAGGMLPYLPLSAGSAVANAGRALLQGGAGGAAGETAAELFPDHPTLARLAGNITGALVGGKAFDAGNKVFGAATGGSTPTLGAYHELKIDPALAGDVSGSPIAQMLQTFAAKSPGGAGRMHAAAGKAVDQWGRALDNTADSLGTARTAQQAGEALQMEGQSWLNQFKSQSRQAWGAVDMQIPQNTPAPVTNYAQTLSAVRNQMPNAPNTASTLQPALTQKLLDGLIADTQKGPLTWQDVKGIRTRVGEMLAEPQLVGDTGYTDLKRLYGALSDDLANVAASRGPAAQAAFTQANDVTRGGHDFIETVLSRVLKGNQITPEQAANAALANAPSGGTLLRGLRQEMPQAADELAAYKLRDMGLANAGQQNASSARMSPGTFVTEKAKLSPEAIDALFGADPQVARQVQNLAQAGSSMKSTAQFLNTSNTGTHGAVGHAAMGVAGMIPAGIEGYVHYGIPGALAGAAGSAALPFLPGLIASRLSSSPALTSLLASPAAAPVSQGLLSRAALLPPALRGLLFGAAGQP